MKILLVAILSLGLVACKGGNGASDDPSIVYGVDYDYDMEHPSEVTVDAVGNLLPFEINAFEMSTACGRNFYKDSTSGRIFTAHYDSSSSTAYVAKQIGHYPEYDKGLGGFQNLEYQFGDIISVGRYVVISSMSPSFVSEYGYKTRTNYTAPSESAHDNCMLYIDEQGTKSGSPDVYEVNLTTEVFTSIF